MKALAILLFTLATGCGSDGNSQETCEAAADHVSSLSNSKKRKAKHVKIEYEANIKECLAVWSKRKVDCVLAAKTHTKMMSCHAR